MSTPANEKLTENNENDFVVLGKIIGFFGVRGWVKVYSDTDPRENIVSYSQWWLGGAKQRKPITVRGGKRSGKHVVAQLDGVDTREKAEVYIGKEIAVLRTMLPKLKGDEVYWTDLVGCMVEDLQGVEIGPVERMFDTGANDVMVVRDQRDTASAKGQKPEDGEILIPWVRPSVVTSVDVDAQRIVVDWDPDF